MIMPRVRMLSLLRLYTYRAAALLMLGAQCAVAGSPIPVGDPREGYDRTDYQSDSLRIGEVGAQQMDLARLAASPPLGLPPLKLALDARAIDLGRQLFFDRRLSVNATLSCGMCHIPNRVLLRTSWPRR